MICNSNFEYTLCVRIKFCRVPNSLCANSKEFFIESILSLISKIQSNLTYLKCHTSYACHKLNKGRIIADTTFRGLNFFTHGFIVFFLPGA